MHTISQIREKIKLFISTHAEELAVSLIIILVAFSCFYLGRLSMSGTLGRGITIENAPASSAAASIPEGQVKGAAVAPIQVSEVVASKNGKRYYYPHCSGVSRISPANIVHYASAAEAEKFGLKIAANCNAK